jgi:hypothetical protein
LVYKTQKNLILGMKMAYKSDERTVAGDIPIKLFEDFENQRSERGQVKKAAIGAAIRLWTELPPEIQAKLIGQSLEGSAFVELVRDIVDEHIKAKQPTSIQASPRKQLHNAIEHLKEMVQIEQQQPGTIYRVLDQDEQKIIDEFRALVGPRQKKKSRSA